jgi:TolB protein
MKMLLNLFSVVALALMFNAVAVPSIGHAQDEDRIYIKVGEANVKKSLLALPPFLFLSSPSVAPNYKSIGADLYNTVSNDLDVSNLFTTIKQSAYLEDVTKVGLTPAPANPNGFHFDLWQKIGTDFLIRGGYKVTGDSLEFEVYVYYVPQAKLVLGKKYDAKVKDVRTTAHAFCDDLMKALTGKKGIFRTKFVVGSDRAGHKWKEIYVMDWDGRNLVQITNHHSISFSPAWNPDGKTVSYSSYAYHTNLKRRNADLFTYDIFSGKRYLVSSHLGLNTGSTFSPEGKNIFLTLTKEDEDADIYRITLEGDDLTRITNGPRGAVNVEPAISPDGKKIAFSSTRSGNPMIYIMDIDGTNVKRLTFAGQYNSSPSWSPDGKKLAFAGQDKDHFDVFTVGVDGTDMQRLTSARGVSGRMSNNEDPSFSPDGRHILFTSNRSGTYQLYIISVDGTNERRITVDHHNYERARWSPYFD